MKLNRMCYVKAMTQALRHHKRKTNCTVFCRSLSFALKYNRTTKTNVQWANDLHQQQQLIIYCLKALIFQLCRSFYFIHINKMDHMLSLLRSKIIIQPLRALVIWEMKKKKELFLLDAMDRFKTYFNIGLGFSATHVYV